MVYMIVGRPLQWALEANSPEEAHAKFRGLAAKIVAGWKDPEAFSVTPEIRREVVKVMHNKFQVEARPDVQQAWSDAPRWAKQ